MVLGERPDFAHHAQRLDGSLLPLLHCVPGAHVAADEVRCPHDAWGSGPDAQHRPDLGLRLQRLQGHPLRRGASCSDGLDRHEDVPDLPDVDEARGRPPEPLPRQARLRGPPLGPAGAAAPGHREGVPGRPPAGRAHRAHRRAADVLLHAEPQLRRQPGDQGAADGGFHHRHQGRSEPRRLQAHHGLHCGPAVHRRAELQRRVRAVRPGPVHLRDGLSASDLPGHLGHLLADYPVASGADGELAGAGGRRGQPGALLQVLHPDARELAGERHDQDQAGAGRLRHEEGLQPIRLPGAGRLRQHRLRGRRRERRGHQLRHGRGRQGLAGSHRAHLRGRRQRERRPEPPVVDADESLECSGASRRERQDRAGPSGRRHLRRRLKLLERHRCPSAVVSYDCLPSLV